MRQAKITHAHGLSEIASASDLTRDALYNALRPVGSPRFDTISMPAPFRQDSLDSLKRLANGVITKAGSERT